MGIKKNLKKIMSVENHLMDRIMDGIENLPAKEISAFIIQNAAEGFARGLVKELKNNG